MNGDSTNKASKFKKNPTLGFLLRGLNQLKPSFLMRLAMEIKKRTWAISPGSFYIAQKQTR
ncbi:hypothetical protein BSR82_13350 [Bacillus subtilis]|nr:hypothetical protein BSR82_13350 [Bacillus subtilis]PAE62332.1 hypothetical protein CHH88_00305 [Bacillus subtilis]